jgi:hypothetical protein
MVWPKCHSIRRNENSTTVLASALNSACNPQNHLAHSGRSRRKRHVPLVFGKLHRSFFEMGSDYQFEPIGPVFACGAPRMTRTEFAFRAASFALIVLIWANGAMP